MATSQRTTLRRVLTVTSATVLLGAAAILAPSAANAVDDGDAVCEVADATFEWSVIERFRSYISGSIANGEWTTEGNVQYETPTFTWSDGTGSMAPDGSSGEVAFEGSIDFSGHGGILQVQLANPTIEIVSPTEGYVLLDLTSTDTSGAPATAESQVRAVALELDGTAAVDGPAITFADVSGTLTPEGASAFGGFYEAGEPVDALTLTVPDCTVAEPEPEQPPIEDEPEVTTQEEPEETTEPEGSDVPWLPIIIGGAAVVVIAVAATLLITGRKRGDDLKPDEDIPSE